MQQALDQDVDMAIRQWQAESGKLSARIQPLVSYQQDGTDCRQARVRLDHSDRRGERFQFDFCRNNNGWDISYTPASSFNNDDWSILQQTVQRTLNDNQAGQPSSWTNHKTKHSGVVVASDNEMNGGKRCRQTAISIFDHNGRASNGSYLFCLQQDGSWQRQL